MLRNRAIETEANCESGISRRSSPIGAGMPLSRCRGGDAPLTYTLFLHEPKVVGILRMP